MKKILFPILLLFACSASAALIQPPVAGTGSVYTNRLLFSLAGDQTTNRIWYTNSTAAFGNVNTSQVNVKSNTSSHQWEWRSGSTVLATNPANRHYGIWKANAAGAAIYGYTVVEPIADYTVRVDALGVVTAPANFATANSFGAGGTMSDAEFAARASTNTAGAANVAAIANVASNSIYAGNSNVTQHAVYGDSIMAGVGSGSQNSMPNRLVALGAPWLSISQTNVTRNKDGVDYTHFTGCWPGDNSIVIVNAAVDATNAPNRESISHLWLGHNDFSQNVGAAFPSAGVTNQIATNYLRLITWLGHSNYLVYPVLGDTNWTIGTTAYQNLTNFNVWLSNYFAPSGHFVNYLPDLMRQAADSTDQAQTNLGTAPWRFFNGPIHPLDAGHTVIATNAYQAVERLMARTPATVSTVLQMQRRFTPVDYGPLTWVTPTYCPSWTLYNGSSMNFGGAMSGTANYGIGGSIDAVKAPTGTGTYSIHRIPRGQWTNIDLTFTVSTDAPVGGSGATFEMYGYTMCQNTNTLTYDQYGTSVATIANVKSNSWVQVTLSGSFPNTWASRQIRLYIMSAANGNLTNNVYISDAFWKGYNY